MTIRDDVRDFVVKAFCVPREVSDDAPLLDNGIIDSTSGLLEVIAFIEESYIVQVAVRDIRPENFGSIARIAGYIEGKLAELQTSPVGALRLMDQEP